MHFCRACRRPLTSEVSIKYGLGSVCLRKAVAAGTAPLESLTELSAEQRETKRRKATRCKPEPIVDTRTLDLFDYARREAIDALLVAVAECLAVGVVITYTIEG